MSDVRACTLVLFLSLAAFAHAPAAVASAPAAAPAIQITKAWARPTPPGATVAAAYFEMRNVSKQADRLLEIASTVAERTELHETKTGADGVATMRPVPALVLAPGATVKLEPGGAHVMLMGVKAPLVETQRVPLRLRFEKAGWVDVAVVVGPVDPGADHSMHRHH